MSNLAPTASTAAPSRNLTPAPHPSQARSQVPSQILGYTRAFTGLILRDLYVLRREVLPFLLRVGMQPLLFAFVFTYVMPHMAGDTVGTSPVGVSGRAGGGFGTVMLPGLMAVGIMFSGIAAVALPLATEFSITREIDDRVMSPLPIWAVAAEKVCFSAMQSLLAAAVVFPLAYYIPAIPVVAHVTSWPLLAAVLLLSSLVSGALGLVIGTAVQPKQIGLVFGIVVTPIVFLGCVYYPWTALGNLRWLQVLILVNPIVYFSEGLRSALTPGVGHMQNGFILGALVFFFALLMGLGIRGFRRRVVS